MATQPTAPQAGPAYQTEFHWKEYEILQEKIDKIGAFRFQIKNWVVVIVSTAVISGYYAKLPWWVFPFYLFVVFSFWLFEMKQKGFQDAYINRAKYLEGVLRKNNRFVFSPRRHRKYSTVKNLMKLEPMSLGEALYLNELHIKRNKVWHWLMKWSHDSFYVIVGLLVLAVCIAASSRSHDIPRQQIEFSSPLEIKRKGTGSAQVAPNVVIKNEIVFPASPHASGNSTTGQTTDIQERKVQPTLQSETMNNDDAKKTIDRPLNKTSDQPDSAQRKKNSSDVSTEGSKNGS